MISRARRNLSALTCVVALAWTGNAIARPLKILTSIVPVYSLTAGVAGDLATVENLLPANVDPHDYQLGPRDLAKLQDADVVVINGLGLEDWLLKVLKSARRDKPPVIVELAGGLTTNQLIYDADAPWDRPTSHVQRDREAPNPHIWLDPQLAQHGVKNISEALQKADPANARLYARNTESCLGTLQQLDETIRKSTASFRQRDIVTEHNAFPYFARRYGLNVVGVVQEVDDVPPSPRHLSRLHEAIRKDNIKVLFTSPPSPGREAQRVAADLKLQLSNLNTLEVGPLKANTYDVEMRENLAALEKFLR